MKKSKILIIATSIIAGSAFASPAPENANQNDPQLEAGLQAISKYYIDQAKNTNIVTLEDGKQVLSHTPKQIAEANAYLATAAVSASISAVANSLDCSAMTNIKNKTNCENIKQQASLLEKQTKEYQQKTKASLAEISKAEKEEMDKASNIVIENQKKLANKNNEVYVFLTGLSMKCPLCARAAIDTYTELGFHGTNPKQIIHEYKAIVKDSPLYAFNLGLLKTDSTTYNVVSGTYRTIANKVA